VRSRGYPLPKLRHPHPGLALRGGGARYGRQGAVVGGGGPGAGGVQGGGGSHTCWRSLDGVLDLPARGPELLSDSRSTTTACCTYSTVEP
jgi:hypothetical protein